VTSRKKGSQNPGAFLILNVFAYWGGELWAPGKVL